MATIAAAAPSHVCAISSPEAWDRSAKLVSQEGGKALILSLLGYPADAGFAVGLLRRVKEMAWVLFGLAALAAHRMFNERAGDRVACPPHNAIEVPRAHGRQSL